MLKAKPLFDEIMRLVYGSEHLGIARIGASIHDIKTTLPEGWTIKSWQDPERSSLWFYQLQRPQPTEFRQVPIF